MQRVTFTGPKKVFAASASQLACVPTPTISKHRIGPWCPVTPRQFLAANGFYFIANDSHLQIRQFALRARKAF
jgi:hypothetical protein